MIIIQVQKNFIIAIITLFLFNINFDIPQVVSDLVDSLSIFQQWTNDVFGGSNSSSRFVHGFYIFLFALIIINYL